MKALDRLEKRMYRIEIMVVLLLVKGGADVLPMVSALLG